MLSGQFFVCWIINQNGTEKIWKICPLRRYLFHYSRPSLCLQYHQMGSKWWLGYSSIQKTFVRVCVCAYEKKQTTHYFTACTVCRMHISIPTPNTCKKNTKTATTMKVYEFIIIMQLWTQTNSGETNVWYFLYTWLEFILCWRAIKAFFPFFLSSDVGCC